MRNANENIFALLRQDGPFATGDQPPACRTFSAAARWRTRLLAAAGMEAMHRIYREQIFDLLAVSSVGDMEALGRNAERRAAAERRLCQLLGNMFGLNGSEREVMVRLKTYSQTADGVIRYLRGKVLADYAPHIEITNEIDASSSPLALLLVLFDPRYHKKARFEAKRKLILMRLAGAIDQREREMDIENKFLCFLDFLNDHVWSGQLRIGELESVYLLSDHDSDAFACKKVRVVSLEEAEGLLPTPGQKLTLIKRRRFRFGGRNIPVYVSIRKKPPEAKVLKLLRKGEENPAVAVDDELGLMGVLESTVEVKSFQKHLAQSAIASGSVMVFEEIADSLTGRPHCSGNIGSNACTPMLKFFARLGGMRVEFIVHTHESYLNYSYQRDVAHDEYEVRRIFDSGVAQLLFPADIYHLDMEKIRGRIIDNFRRRLERAG